MPALLCVIYLYIGKENNKFDLFIAAILSPVIGVLTLLLLLLLVVIIVLYSMMQLRTRYYMAVCSHTCINVILSIFCRKYSRKWQVYNNPELVSKHLIGFCHLILAKNF